MDGWMDEWMDRMMDGWIDGWSGRVNEGRRGHGGMERRRGQDRHNIVRDKDIETYTNS